MKAKFIKSLAWRGRAEVYRVDPPIDGHDHVVISQVEVPGPFGGWETFIFGSDAEGVVPSMLDLPGSRRGDENLTPAALLRELGYTIEGDATVRWSCRHERKAGDKRCPVCWSLYGKEVLV